MTGVGHEYIGILAYTGQLRSQTSVSDGVEIPSFLFLPFPSFPSFPFPFPFFTYFQLSLSFPGALSRIYSYRAGERCKLPQRVRAEPGCQTVSGAFLGKSAHFLTVVLNSFLVLTLERSYNRQDSNCSAPALVRFMCRDDLWRQWRCAAYDYGSHFRGHFGGGGSGPPLPRSLIKHYPSWQGSVTVKTLSSLGRWQHA